jgi:hypothetical protein
MGKRLFSDALNEPSDSTSSPRQKRSCTNSKDNKIEEVLSIRVWSLRKLQQLLFCSGTLLILFLQKTKLISSTRKCPECNVEMELVEKSDRIDGWIWLCPISGCKKEISIRKNSFFEKSKLQLSAILTLVFCWFTKSSQENAANEAGLLTNFWHTTGYWFNFCRDVCRDKLFSDNHAIGGPGKIVEIDESAFGKRKYHRGSRRNTYWVFGGVERGSKQCTVFNILGFYS